MRVLFWGIDSPLVRLEIEKFLAANGAVDSEQRTRDSLPGDVAEFLHLSQAFDVFVVPLTLRDWSSLLLPHVLHRSGSKARTILRTGGNTDFARPLFDSVWPNDVA
jgi:hypothetical protein